MLSLYPFLELGPPPQRWTRKAGSRQILAQRTTCSSQGHLSDGPNLELGLNQTGGRWWLGFPGWVLGVGHQPRSVGPWSFRVVTGSQGPYGIRVCVRCLCSIKSNKFQPPQGCHPSQRENRPSIFPISPGQSYSVPLALPVDSDLPVMSRVRALEELSVVSSNTGSFSGRQLPPVLGAA